MLRRWISLVAATLLVLPSAVQGQKDTEISAFNAIVKYGTADNGDNGISWYTDDRSDICRNPRMVTRKLGDYMEITFEGTAITVTGTTGASRGIVDINLDGAIISKFDRTAEETACDVSIFVASGLSNVQHTLRLTLTERALSPNGNGTMVGFLTVQNIRYGTGITYTSTAGSPGPTATNNAASVSSVSTASVAATATNTPTSTATSQASNKSSVPIGAIVGGAVGGAVLFGLIIAFCLWRRRKANAKKNRPYIDDEPAPSHDHPSAPTANPYFIYNGTERPATSPGTESKTNVTMSDTPWLANTIPSTTGASSDNQSKFVVTNSSGPTHNEKAGHRPMSMPVPDSSMGDPRSSQAWSQSGSSSSPSAMPPFGNNSQGQQPWMDMLAEHVLSRLENREGGTPLAGAAPPAYEPDQQQHQPQRKS